MKALIYKGIVIGCDSELEIVGPNVVGSEQSFAGLDLSRVLIVDCDTAAVVGHAYDEKTGSFTPVAMRPASTSKKVSPIEFKLLFTATERVAIKTSTDPIVMDFFELVEQQREVNARDPLRGLVDMGMQSTRDAIDYLIKQGLVDPARREVILSGVLQ